MATGYPSRYTLRKRTGTAQVAPKSSKRKTGINTGLPVEQQVRRKTALGCHEPHGAGPLRPTVHQPYAIRHRPLLAAPAARIQFPDAPCIAPREHPRPIRTGWAARKPCSCRRRARRMIATAAAAAVRTRLLGAPPARRPPRTCRGRPGARTNAPNSNGFGLCACGESCRTLAREASHTHAQVIAVL